MICSKGLKDVFCHKNVDLAYCCPEELVYPGGLITKVLRSFFRQKTPQCYDLTEGRVSSHLYNSGSVFKKTTKAV